MDEITVVGSRYGPFERAIELLGTGAIHVRPLITGTYPLEQYSQAFDRARDGLKVIFTI